jgi:hypothetical protein
VLQQIFSHCLYSWTTKDVSTICDAVNSTLCCCADNLQVVQTDERVAEIHANAEVFDRKAELSFKYLQVRPCAGQLNLAAAQI